MKKNYKVILKADGETHEKGGFKTKREACKWGDKKLDKGGFSSAEIVEYIADPQFNAGKHSDLYEVFNDWKDCQEASKLLEKIEVCSSGLQYIIDQHGDNLGAILWFNVCRDILEDLQENIDEGCEDVEIQKSQQALVERLQDFMSENDLVFIFI